MLEKKLKERNVFISPGGYFFINNNDGKNAFRLCISKLKRDQIKTGMEIIFEDFSLTKTNEIL